MTRHSRAVGITVAVAGIVTSGVLSGCSSEPATPAATGMPTEVIETTTTTPSAPAGLGFGTYGEIKLGMSTSDVIAHGFTLGQKIQADGCDGYELSHDPEGQTVGLYFKPTTGQLSKIQVDGGTAVLPGLQPSVADVRAAYSNATVTDLAARGPLGPRLSVQQDSEGPLIIHTVVGDTATRPTTVSSVAPGCPAPR